MAGQDRFMRWLFVALMLSSAAFLAIITLYPVKSHVAGMQFLRWTYQNVLDTTWFTYVFLALFIGAIGLIVIGWGLLILKKAYIWYRRLRGPNYRQYDDPEYVED